MWPSLSIWIKPEATFEQLSQLATEVINKKINRNLFLIALSQGFFFEIVSTQELTFQTMGLGLLASCIVFISYKYIWPWLLLLISRVFNGKANIIQIRLACAYSLIPYLLNGLIILALLIDEYFITDLDIIRANTGATNWIAAFLAIRFFVYSLSLFNKISYLYSLITILILMGGFEAIKLIVR